MLSCRSVAANLVRLVPAPAAPLLDRPGHCRYLSPNLRLHGHPSGDHLGTGRFPEPASPAPAVVSVMCCSTKDTWARDADLLAPVAPADLRDFPLGQLLHALPADPVAAAALVAAAVRPGRRSVGIRGRRRGRGDRLRSGSSGGCGHGRNTPAETEHPDSLPAGGARLETSFGHESLLARLCLNSRTLRTRSEISCRRCRMVPPRSRRNWACSESS